MASITSYPVHHLINGIRASFKHLAEVTIALCEHAGDIEATVADLGLPEENLHIQLNAPGGNLAYVENSNKHHYPQVHAPKKPRAPSNEAGRSPRWTRRAH